MRRLPPVLLEDGCPRELISLIRTVLAACKEISFRVGQGALSGVLGSTLDENIQGETQKKLDVLTNQLLKESLRKKIIPIVYIHPYEFNNGNNFRITFRQLKLPLLNRLYWTFRQTQWLNFMNFTTSKKIFKLNNNYQISGELKRLL